MVNIDRSQVPTEGGETVGELESGFLRCAHLPLRHSLLLDLAHGVISGGVEARRVERRVPSNGAHLRARLVDEKGSNQNTLPPPLYRPVPWNAMTASSLHDGLT